MGGGLFLLGSGCPSLEQNRNLDVPSSLHRTVYRIFHWSDGLRCRSSAIDKRSSIFGETVNGQLFRSADGT